MVVFLSTGLLEQLSRELMAGGYRPDTPAAIVYKATWPEEKKFLCTVETLAQTAKENGITKTALMIIVGRGDPERLPALSAVRPGLFHGIPEGQPHMSGGERGWEPPGPRGEGVRKPCAVISFNPRRRPDGGAAGSGAEGPGIPGGKLVPGQVGGGISGGVSGAGNSGPVVRFPVPKGGDLIFVGPAALPCGPLPPLSGVRPKTRGGGGG